jgi:hypothetical protein
MNRQSSLASVGAQHPNPTLLERIGLHDRPQDQERSIELDPVDDASVPGACSHCALFAFACLTISGR